MRDYQLKYLLVLPAVIVVFATAIWPLTSSFRLAFYQGRLSRSAFPQGFIGTDNYTWALWDEPAFWNAVVVTGIYTVITVVLTTLFALGLALL